MSKLRLVVIVGLLTLSDGLLANDILEASRSGDLELVQTILDSDKTAIGMSNDRGSTALHIAVANGHIRIVELLLDLGADLEAIDVDGDTPLMRAAIGGHSEIFKLLLSRGADAHIKNINKHDILHYAVLGGSVEIIDHTLDMGRDINAKSRDGSTPLFQAVWKNDREVARFLLEKGADIEAQNNHGFTPLYVARAVSNVDMAQLLVDNGANVEAPVGFAARALNNQGFDWKTRSSDHFRVYYLPGSVAEREIDTLIKQNEAHLASHLALLGVTDYDKVVDLFYCDSRDQVKEICSYPVRGISQPGSRTVLTIRNDEEIGRDAHEIMHVVSSDLWGGWEWNRAPALSWLSEGLACYADEPCNGYEPAELAAHILKNTGNSVPLDSLATDFRQHPEMIGYMLMASFVHFVLDQHGIELFHNLWNEGYDGFERVFGKDVATVEQEWHKYMEKKYPNPQVPDWADLTEHGCK
ncbi:MAG: ankyrin repeat domain-containing protein [Candidatus Zixiibacteriota bacterium]|nr:MAG: ankyrin repeat domain-containing protein [candidate division Zixibacteria bacterium]